jgi:hypothetical protein
VKRLYALLLYLFPRAYREEYGGELQAVFDLSLDDAMESGGLEVASVALRELIDLPKAIIHEHLRERRKVKMVRKFGAYFDFTHGSGWEFLAAVYPFFLLGGVLPIINMISLSGVMRFPNPLFDGIAILLLAILGILCIIGLFKGLPRWSLTYLGFLLAIFSVYQVGSLLDRWCVRIFPALYDRSWFLGQVAYQGMLWVGLSIMALLLVLVIGFVPALRRFKKDWTLLPLLLYGSTPFALVFTFDDYVNEEPYELVCFLVLATGLWLYLRTNDPRRQFWALFGRLTISLFLAAGSKAILFSSPSWPWPKGSFTWQNEMMSTIIMWMWIALGMLVPLLIRLFPQSRDQLQAA